MMAVFKPFCALAVNCMVLPTCIDTMMEGFRVILAGKGEAPAGLCPPHAGRSKKAGRRKSKKKENVTAVPAS